MPMFRAIAEILYSSASASSLLQSIKIPFVSKPKDIFLLSSKYKSRLDRLSSRNMFAPDFTCSGLAALRNFQSQASISIDGLNSIEKGLSGSKSHLRPFLTTPGAASGTIWLGTIIPEFPHEQDDFLSGPPPSKMVTS